ADYINHPVGTGPFMYAENERVKGSSLTFVKNPNYWQKGLPKLDKIVYKIFPDPNVGLMNFKSGQVDVLANFPASELNNHKNDASITVFNEPSFAFQGIWLNMKKPPFDKQELRQAVDLLIDREALTKVALNGSGTPANSPFTPKSLAFGDSDKNVKPDLEGAKELLKKAGKADGFSFTLSINTDLGITKSAQMIQTMLKPAGITMNIEKLEPNALFEKTQKGDYEAASFFWSGRIDPDQNSFDFFSTGGVMNFAPYNNKDVDKLLTEARLEGDPAKRKGLYDEIMTKIHLDVPYVFLYHAHNLFGFSKSVGGFTYIPDGIIRTANLSKN
ncbi:MAG: ABC transporter substrate-binding protein, partial [Desulfitobacteriaceae bacterium]